MSYTLFDQTLPFYGLFQQQYALLNESVRRLDDIFQDFSAVPEKCKRIHALSTEADLVSRAITRELALTLILPLDRADIHDLNRAFEETIGAVKAVATRIGLYGFREIHKAARELTTNLCEMVAELGPMLEKLVLKGGVEENRERVRTIKNEADMFVLVGLGEIYETGAANTGDLLAVMKWGQIYDRLETTIGCVERTVNILESIILKKV